MKKLFAAVAATLLLAGPARAQVTIPNTLVAGATIRAADLNTNFSSLGSAALNRTGGTLTGNITASGGVTIDGIDIGATVCTTCTLTVKDLVLSSPATGLTVAGNVIVNSSGKIPALTSTYFTSLSFAASNLTGALPAIDGSALTGVSGTPAGIVAFSTGVACPTGWTEYTALRGRVAVGLPSGGTAAGTVGSAYTDLENRTHTHTISGSTRDIQAGTGQSVLDGLTSPSGATSATPPYIQLIACVKS